MKIHLANQSNQGLGGGWTFLRTLEKYARRQGVDICGADDADIVVVSGVTMVQRDAFKQWKAAGKKVVVRVDNMPRNSRNRNTGSSRLADFCQEADLVIYQSEWAKKYLGPFVKCDGPVILNGADDDIFKPEGSVRPTDGKPQYLYTRFNRDETKNWHVAWYDYIMRQRAEPNAHLWLVGQFSPELLEYNFDFFAGERFAYLGVMDNPEDMAEIYRSAGYLMMPYYNDACSNTLIEFLRCHPNGVVVNPNMSGGTPEILAAWENHSCELAASHMTSKYIDQFEKLLKRP